MLLRRPVAVLAALVVLGPLAACGGDDEPAPDPTPEATEAFDPAELDLGRIDPTRTDLSAAASPELARRAASYELGELLVQPQEVDPELIMANVDSGSAVSPEDFGFVFEGDTTPLQSSTAAIVARKSDPDFENWIATGVVAFPDEAAAQAAAAAMHQLALAPVPEEFTPDPYAASEVPGRAAALGGTRVVADWVTVKVFEAAGPFVMYAWISEDVEPETALDLAADFLDEQAERLEDTQPVVANDSPTKRELDPSGLWGLTLATDVNGGLAETAHLSGPRASLIHQIDLEGLDDAYEDSGLERVATNAAVLYRTSEDGGPQILLDAFVTQAEKANLEVTDPPPGLEDDATCVMGEVSEIEGVWPTHMCWIVFEDTLIEAGGSTIEEARQVASAQLMLVFQSGGDRKRMTG